jgi:hypothetical protein
MMAGDHFRRRQFLALGVICAWRLHDSADLIDVDPGRWGERAVLLLRCQLGSRERIDERRHGGNEGGAVWRPCEIFDAVGQGTTLQSSSKNGSVLLSLHQ